MGVGGLETPTNYCECLHSWRDLKWTWIIFYPVKKSSDKEYNRKSNWNRFLRNNRYQKKSALHDWKKRFDSTPLIRNSFTMSNRERKDESLWKEISRCMNIFISLWLLVQPIFQDKPETYIRHELKSDLCSIPGTFLSVRKCPVVRMAMSWHW